MYRPSGKTALNPLKREALPMGRLRKRIEREDACKISCQMKTNNDYEDQERTNK